MDLSDTHVLKKMAVLDGMFVPLSRILLCAAELHLTLKRTRFLSLP